MTRRGVGQSAQSDTGRPAIAGRDQAMLSEKMSVKPVGLDKSVSETLPQVVQRIAQALQPEKIILFGSYGYGAPTPDSDVDLLVVMETSAPPLERYLTVSRLLRPRPFPVDILVKTPEEIEHALEFGDFFLTEICSRGQVLYERQSFGDRPKCAPFCQETDGVVKID